MGIKAVIIGFKGEQLTEKLKQKINKLVSSAVNDYMVSDFYFANESEYLEDAEFYEKNSILKE